VCGYDTNGVKWREATSPARLAILQRRKEEEEKEEEEVYYQVILDYYQVILEVNFS
jgi:hypothetical protein